MPAAIRWPCRRAHAQQHAAEEDRDQGQGRPIKEETGFKIAKIHLTTTASVPGIDAAKFKEIAETAKKNCPVSKVLAAAEITLDAKLV